MMNRTALLLLPSAALLLSGCLAKTALDVVTAPVRVAGKAADLATTSQSESDENRGRDLRKREARYGKLERQYAQEISECGQGKMNACDAADRTRAEMDDLRPTIPAAR